MRENKIQIFLGPCFWWKIHSSRHRKVVFEKYQTEMTRVSVNCVAHTYVSERRSKRSNTVKIEVNFLKTNTIKIDFFKWIALWTNFLVFNTARLLSKDIYVVWIYTCIKFYCLFLLLVCWKQMQFVTRLVKCISMPIGSSFTASSSWGARYFTIWST